MRKMRRGWIMVLATMALMLVCVVVQGYVGLAANQYVDVAVTNADQGWAVVVDYGTGAMEWHGPHYSNFDVTWPLFLYNRWYGVFVYNASFGYYRDGIFKYAVMYTT